MPLVYRTISTRWRLTFGSNKLWHYDGVRKVGNEPGIESSQAKYFLLGNFHWNLVADADGFSRSGSQRQKTKIICDCGPQCQRRGPYSATDRSRLVVLQRRLFRPAIQQSGPDHREECWLTARAVGVSCAQFGFAGSHARGRERLDVRSLS